VVESVTGTAGLATCRVGLADWLVVAARNIRQPRMVSTSDSEWWHLQRLIDALVDRGNATCDGMRPNQGGFDCYMTRVLDPDVIGAVIAEDVHRGKVTVTTTGVFCRSRAASPSASIAPQPRRV